MLMLQMEARIYRSERVPSANMSMQRGSYFLSSLCLQRR